MATLVAGCSSAPTAVYKLYPGPPLPSDQIAHLELHEADSAVIDGLSVNRSDYRVVSLLPGLHRVRLKSEHMVSVLIEPSGWAGQASEHSVLLEAGHTYRLRSDRTTGHGYRIFHWIEDVASGDVVAGKKKP